MALTIVRNDIVKMKVDAIVNSTNEFLQPGGHGVDAAIHAAAGPGLQEELNRVGYCAPDCLVITGSHNIKTCSHIIHVVGPQYIDGQHGEAEALWNCYDRILNLAYKKCCRSLAIPSISSGAYAFPKEEAYKIATSCIRQFLFSLGEDEDMMIYLVLFDQQSVEYGNKIDGAVKEYISPSYPEKKKQGLGLKFKLRKNAVTQAPQFGGSIPAGAMLREDHDMSILGTTVESDYAEKDLSFAEMCEWWCEEKNISKKVFYVSANINKSMFWNMKHHPEQIPKKTNVLACAIGLQLDYDQTQDLLMRAGMTLTHYYALDRLVESYIRKGNYDIFEINEKLFEQDLPLLGAC